MTSEQLSFVTLGGTTVTVRKRGKHYVQPRGYAASPGTGPEGETCGSCEHAHRFGHFIKCEANKARWSRGRGTDILAGSAACRKWESDAAGIVASSNVDGDAHGRWHAGITTDGVRSGGAT